MNYETLNQAEKTALLKYVELEQMELLGCTNDSDLKLKSYTRCSIGPEKVKIKPPSKILVDIQQKVINDCRIKKRNKAQK